MKRYRLATTPFPLLFASSVVKPASERHACFWLDTHSVQGPDVDGVDDKVLVQIVQMSLLLLVQVIVNPRTESYTTTENSWTTYCGFTRHETGCYEGWQLVSRLCLINLIASATQYSNCLLLEHQDPLLGVETARGLKYVMAASLQRQTARNQIA